MKFLRSVAPSVVISSVFLSALQLFALPVNANPCASFPSYIRMPNGRCYDLNHLTIVSQSRTGVAGAASLYKTAIDVNVSMGSATEVTEMQDNKRVTTRTSDDPTVQERLGRRKFLQDSSKLLKNAVATNEDIERWAWLKQRRVLNAVNGQLAGRK